METPARICITEVFHNSPERASAGFTVTERGPSHLRSAPWLQRLLKPSVRQVRRVRAFPIQDRDDWNGAVITLRSTRALDGGDAALRDLRRAAFAGAAGMSGDPFDPASGGGTRPQG